MKDRQELRRTLHRIDGKGYKSYKDMQCSYLFPEFELYVDNVQGDPYASPSRLRVRVPQEKAQIPAELWDSKVRRVACEDFLTRAFHQALVRESEGGRGTGKSGLIAIDRCGQEILERTAMVVNEEYVEARFVMGLPAQGRTVLGRQAEAMFFEDLPAVVRDALYYSQLPARAFRQHVDLCEDQEYLRRQLATRELVAFVANGAVLPRESGVSQQPLGGGGAVPFVSPAGLEVEFVLPNAGPVKGMGVRRGVTLIVGGGYHGKSTLLRALERGIYNHIPGDGRERVVTSPDAQKIRAEDGRRVEKVDISPFIHNLPQGVDTRSFSSDNASGSTSQAANIMEGLETGSSVLLIDEDTSATNFMIRDVRMQHLVPRAKEPITPFVDRVQQLWQELGVSTVLVLGGSGDYLDVADTIIALDEYRPREVTGEAREIAARFQTQRQQESGNEMGQVRQRVPLDRGLSPSTGKKHKIQVRDIDTIQYGLQELELGAVEQLVDRSQTRAVAEILHYAARHYVDGRKTLNRILDLVERDIDQQGLDIISPFQGKNPGDYARPRKQEMAAAFNRLRSLWIR